DEGRWAREDGAATEPSENCGFPVDPGTDRCPDSCPRDVEVPQFLRNVGNYSFRCRRWRGGAEIGDEVEEGGVRLMADRGHYWSGCACCGANKGLVREWQEILHRAASAGDDDDVDVGVGVQRLQCANHLRYAVGPLHRYLADVEGDAGV